MFKIELSLDSLQTCFLRCSPSSFISIAGMAQLQKRIVRFVTPDNKTTTFILTQSSDIRDNKIYLNSTYAKILSLGEGDIINLELVENSNHLSEMTLSCTNDDEYAIAELNKDLIERTFMDQIEVASESMPVLFWVSKSTHIQFIVSHIKPSNALLLSTYTEVNLAPNIMKETKQVKVDNCGPLAKIRFNRDKTCSGPIPSVNINCFCAKRKPVNSMKIISKVGRSNLENILLIVNHCSVCQLFDHSKSSCIATADHCLENYYRENEMIVIKSLPSEQKKIVTISEISANIDIPAFSSILTEFSVLVYAKSLLWKVEFSQISNDYKVKSVEKLNNSANITVGPTCHSLIFESIVDKILHSYTFQTKALTLITSNTPCYGAGKTHIMKSIQHNRQLSNFFVLYTDLTALRGKRVDNISKELTEFLDCCYVNQPAILLVDNLDAVLPSRSKIEDHASGDELFGTRLAYCIVGLFETYKQTNIEIIFSCKTKSSCHPIILEACDRILTLPLLTSAQYLQFLNSLLNDKVGKDKVSSLVSLQSLKSNLSPGEVVKLSQLLTLYYNGSMSKDDATEGVSRICKLFELEKKKLPTDGLRLEDCGGLSEVKQEINKMLVLPFQYPDLFAQIPFQLNRGLLLFGPPGVGKTYIVKAIASEIDMNFLSVKGPELLNKYIGASEEAVRNLFTKAQELSPTLIFFDEFDSLAPLRGDDTTGVMDRVVNQLLTELDGVSKRDGVFIIAATSRPDVIDPAVLRPGRIGRNIFCAMPGPGERREIWKCLLHNIKHDNSVNVSVLSDKCKYYSGADIKAVIYNAQLAAVKRCAANDPQVNSIILTQNDLLASIDTTSPSLSIADLENYEKTYDIFLSGRKLNVSTRTTQK